MKRVERDHRLVRSMALLGCLAVLGTAIAADADGPKIEATRENPQEGSKAFQIVTVSAKNDLVTGGDLLGLLARPASRALFHRQLLPDGKEVDAGLFGRSRAH